MDLVFNQNRAELDQNRDPVSNEMWPELIPEYDVCEEPVLLSWTGSGFQPVCAAPCWWKIPNTPNPRLVTDFYLWGLRDKSRRKIFFDDLGD